MTIELDDPRPWWERALQGAPGEIADRYREMPDYLDRALRGVDDDSKINALRAMVNLGVRPDDETNVIVALLGYFTWLGRSVPDAMRAVLPEIDAQLNGFTDNIALFNETSKSVLLEVIDETKRHALELGRAGVQTVSIEEIEKHRWRLTILTKEVLEDFKAKVLEEAHKGADRTRTVRERVIGGIAVALFLLLGISVGWFVSTQKAVSAETSFYVRQGETYVRMWNDTSMPTQVRSWIRSWSARSARTQAP